MPRHAVVHCGRTTRPAAADRSLRSAGSGADGMTGVRIAPSSREWSTTSVVRPAVSTDILAFRARVLATQCAKNGWPDPRDGSATSSRWTRTVRFARRSRASRLPVDRSLPVLTGAAPAEYWRPVPGAAACGRPHMSGDVQPSYFHRHSAPTFRPQPLAVAISRARRDARRRVIAHRPS
jgi:hypothetical protein